MIATMTQHTTNTPGQNIRERSYAFRLSMHDLGATKKVNDAQRDEIARQFGAKKKAVSAQKRLIDADHPEVKAMRAAKAAVKKYFDSMTLPYPENGVRLYPVKGRTDELRSQEIDQFLRQMNRLIENLRAKTIALQDAWGSVIDGERTRLADLFDIKDYPDDVLERISCEIEPVNVELPDYYRRLSPGEYQRAVEALNAKFDEAARMQEQAVAQLLVDAVAQMQHSITRYGEGQQKVFHDSVVEKTFAAIAEFRDKTQIFGGGDAIADAVEQLKAVLRPGETSLGGAEEVARNLRLSSEARSRVTGSLEAIVETISTTMQVVPRRILQRD